MQSNLPGEIIGVQGGKWNTGYEELHSLYVDRLGYQKNLEIEYIFFFMWW